MMEGVVTACQESGFLGSYYITIAPISTFCSGVTEQNSLGNAKRFMVGRASVDRRTLEGLGEAVRSPKHRK